MKNPMRDGILQLFSSLFHLAVKEAAILSNRRIQFNIAFRPLARMNAVMA